MVFGFLFDSNLHRKLDALFFVSVYFILFFSFKFHVKKLLGTLNFQKIMQINVLEKFFLHYFPAFGACLSFLDMVLLLKKALHGDFIVHHEWFFRCSQFAVWVSFSTSSRWVHCF